MMPSSPIAHRPARNRSEFDSALASTTCLHHWQPQRACADRAVGQHEAEAGDVVANLGKGNAGAVCARGDGASNGLRRNRAERAERQSPRRQILHTAVSSM